MDSDIMPALKQAGGTKVSRRTVTRGVAWSVPVAAVAYTAPAYASSQPPVVAGQCGVACKHPGLGQNDKTYHFTFCFKVGDEAIDGNVVNLGLMTINGDAGRQAHSGTLADGVTPKDTVTVGGPGSNSCVFVDADGFGTSETGFAILNFTYEIGGVEFSGCAQAQITGDVCGTSGSSPLKDQPKKWTHDDGAGDPAATVCNPNPGDC
jgi:hypothetical protein